MSGVGEGEGGEVGVAPIESEPELIRARVIGRQPAAELVRRGKKQRIALGWGDHGAQRYVPRVSRDRGNTERLTVTRPRAMLALAHALHVGRYSGRRRAHLSSAA